MKNKINSNQVPKKKKRKYRKFDYTEIRGLDVPPEVRLMMLIHVVLNDDQVKELA